MTDSAQSPMFRAPKRRKVFRSRDEADDDRAPTTTATTTTQHGDPEQLQEGAHLPAEADDGVQELLRQRRLAKGRRRGIGFAQEQLSGRAVIGGDEDNVLTVADAEAPSALATAATRFAAETGQRVLTDDSAMMAYIDSEISKIRAGETVPTDSAEDTALTHNGKTGTIQRQPASIGKITEIDLGPEAALKNESLTDVARRRLLGEVIEEEDARPQKVRLGRDGKPIRRRKRWRRASEDLKRDALVEAVMKESKLDVYDEPEQPIATGNDEAADDMLAEQFRREYMEAAQNRKDNRKPPQTTGARGKVEEPRGPKLGGSRSTRAAYHAQEKAAAAAAAAKR